MKKVVNRNDIKNADNIERCQIILEIIKRTSNIYTRNKNTLEECKKMNDITKQTRKESFEKIQLKKKCKLIYEQLGSGEYTARELAIKMYNTKDEEGKRLLKTNARQETAPRLTELVEKELVEVVKKKYDKESGCSVAVYKRKWSNKYDYITILKEEQELWTINATTVQNF